MPSDPPNAASPPSVFISYASADRPQARLLGESLTHAGLDVWFDEEELAGGEAWDSKIRQQIRTCTYFMPVISATTEARREGYFRREWRLAVERTLDLADDVTFLIPVVIDDTPEYHARVPEKFTAFQWLRCPGGQETPQLLAVARRLVAEHAPAIPSAPATAAPPPPPVPPPKLSSRAATPKGAAAAGLYPFPTFPAFPDHGRRGRFLYDVVVWLGHLLRAFWVRLPRWLRVIAMVLIVIKAINAVFRLTGSDVEETEKKAAATKVIESLALSHRKGDDPSDSALAEKILRATGSAIDSFQSGRPLAIVRFGTTDSSLQAAALSAFAGLHDQLDTAGHESQVAVAAMALPPGSTDAEVYARAAVLKCRWLLAGTVRPAEGNAFTLETKLYEIASQKVLWQSERTANRDDADTAGEALATELLAHISFDPAAPPSPPQK